MWVVLFLAILVILVLAVFAIQGLVILVQQRSIDRLQARVPQHSSTVTDTCSVQTAKLKENKSTDKKEIEDEEAERYHDAQTQTEQNVPDISGEVEEWSHSYGSWDENSNVEVVGGRSIRGTYENARPEVTPTLDRLDRCLKATKVPVEECAEAPNSQIHSQGSCYSDEQCSILGRKWQLVKWDPNAWQLVPVRAAEVRLDREQQQYDHPVVIWKLCVLVTPTGNVALALQVWTPDCTVIYRQVTYIYTGGRQTREWVRLTAFSSTDNDSIVNLHVCVPICREGRPQIGHNENICQDVPYVNELSRGCVYNYAGNRSIVIDTHVFNIREKTDRNHIPLVTKHAITEHATDMQNANDVDSLEDLTNDENVIQEYQSRYVSLGRGIDAQQSGQTAVTWVFKSKDNKRSDPIEMYQNDASTFNSPDLVTDGHTKETATTENERQQSNGSLEIHVEVEDPKPYLVRIKEKEQWTHTDEVKYKTVINGQNSLVIPEVCNDAKIYIQDGDNNSMESDKGYESELSSLDSEQGNSLTDDYPFDNGRQGAEYDDHVTDHDNDMEINVYRKHAGRENEKLAIQSGRNNTLRRANRSDIWSRQTFVIEIVNGHYCLIRTKPSNSLLNRIGKQLTTDGLIVKAAHRQYRTKGSQNVQIRKQFNSADKHATLNKFTERCSNTRNMDMNGHNGPFIDEVPKQPLVDNVDGRLMFIGPNRYGLSSKTSVMNSSGAKETNTLEPVWRHTLKMKLEAVSTTTDTFQQEKVDTQPRTNNMQIHIVCTGETHFDATRCYTNRTGQDERPYPEICHDEHHLLENGSTKDDIFRRNNVGDQNPGQVSHTDIGKAGSRKEYQEGTLVDFSDLCDAASDTIIQGGQKRRMERKWVCSRTTGVVFNTQKKKGHGVKRLHRGHISNSKPCCSSTKKKKPHCISCDDSLQVHAKQIHAGPNSISMKAATVRLYAVPLSRQTSKKRNIRCTKHQRPYLYRWKHISFKPEVPGSKRSLLKKHCPNDTSKMGKNYFELERHYEYMKHKKYVHSKPIHKCNVTNQVTFSFDKGIHQNSKKNLKHPTTIRTKTYMHYCHSLRTTIGTRKDKKRSICNAVNEYNGVQNNLGCPVMPPEISSQGDNAQNGLGYGVEDQGALDKNRRLLKRDVDRPREVECDKKTPFEITCPDRLTVPDDKQYIRMDTSLETIRRKIATGLCSISPASYRNLVESFGFKFHNVSEDGICIQVPELNGSKEHMEKLQQVLKVFVGANLKNDEIYPGVFIQNEHDFDTEIDIVGWETLPMGNDQAYARTHVCYFENTGYD